MDNETDNEGNLSHVHVATILQSHILGFVKTSVQIFHFYYRGQPCCDVARGMETKIDKPPTKRVCSQKSREKSSCGRGRETNCNCGRGRGEGRTGLESSQQQIGRGLIPRTKINKSWPWSRINKPWL